VSFYQHALVMEAILNHMDLLLGLVVKKEMDMHFYCG